MFSVFLRTARYAVCSLVPLPSCSNWKPVQLSLRCLSCSNYYYAQRKKTRSHEKKEVNVQKPKSQKRSVDVYESMTVSEFAKSLGETEEVVLETLLELCPKMLDTLSASQVLDGELVLQAVSSFGCKPRVVPRPRKLADNVIDIGPLPPPPEADLVKRPPVVAIMGHVDHGKTTLLDCLRKSRIVETEFGGITQHIGAFTLNDGKNSITFLDTPGHAAFAQMRERGAHSTDIVVLVIAADDGVKDQTVQSIQYAKDAGVPIVIAFNKCDKPSANPDAAKRSLLPYDIVVEDFHGNVLSAEISALYGTNIDTLRDAILLQAEEMNLRSTVKGLVEGIVIESTTVHGIGKMCTMIVQRGTLKKGCFLVSGTSWARVRLMTDELNRELEVAGPSTPIKVAGWKDSLPLPGERVNQVSDEEQGVRIVAHRKSKKMQEKADKDWAAIETLRAEERKKYLENRQKLLSKGMRFGSTVRAVVCKENRYVKEATDQGASLKLMVFSDVDGTLEAILNVLDTYSSEKVKMQVVFAAVGPPSDADIQLAAETDAVVYCFNLMVNNRVKAAAEDSGVMIENFNVIYRLVEDLKNRLSACLPDETELQVVGEGRVLKEFLVSDTGKKKRSVAGTLVQWGSFTRNCLFRYLRSGKVYYEGRAVSLQCESQDVKTVQTGREVGIAMEDKTVNYKEGDTVVALEEVPVKKVVDWNPPGF